jgi:hypothetical protein
MTSKRINSLAWDNEATHAHAGMEELNNHIYLPFLLYLLLLVLKCTPPIPVVPLGRPS